METEGPRKESPCGWMAASAGRSGSNCKYYPLNGATRRPRTGEDRAAVQRSDFGGASHCERAYKVVKATHKTENQIFT